MYGVLVLVSFIERLGANILWPFFTLYITGRFEVGMTQAGLVLGAFSAFGLIGNILGGALADKFGRKSVILIGLVFSALSTLSLGLVTVSPCGWRWAAFEDLRTSSPGHGG